jgi:hypothetical protein
MRKLGERIPAFVIAAGLVVAQGSMVAAQGMGQNMGQNMSRAALGWGHMFTNDYIGDGKDRWRTGAYTFSLLYGSGWDGQAPATFGDILEFRARAEIIAPDNLARLKPGDRRYAGTLTFGVHTHFAIPLADMRLGADLAITGPQTGLDEFQKVTHDILGLTDPGVLSTQIGNAFYPTLSGEIGHSFALTDTIRLRPFAEAQAGVETFVRVGSDIVFGRYGQNALLLRDTTTGQRYSGIDLDQTPGVSLIFGGDITHIENSEYLSDSELKNTRKRLRGGLHWRGGWGEIFYGATWLSEEFVGQPDDQIVGSIKIDMRF